MARSAAAAPPGDKRRYVREMFSEIAPRYDLLNRLISFNLDRGWRRRALRRLGWERCREGVFLDACAGTFDLALALAAASGFAGRVIAADFALPMLRLGAAKAAGLPVRAAAADALLLPFAEGSFDGAMVGWGVRNLADIGAGLAELRRVLRPGARLVVLDSTNATPAPLRPLFLLYFRRVLPLLGRLVSGHPTAYSYLPDSVRDFPPPAALETLLRQAGFADTGFDLLAGGAVAVHWGRR